MSWIHAFAIAMLLLSTGSFLAAIYGYRKDLAQANEKLAKMRVEDAKATQQIVNFHKEYTRLDGKYRELLDAAAAVTNHSDYQMSCESYIEFCKLRDLARRG